MRIEPAKVGRNSIMRLILIYWVIGFHVLANAEDESYDHYDYYTYDEEPDGLTPGTALTLLMS